MEYTEYVDFDVVFHGAEFADYFQGCGTSFTPYNNVVTGVGDCEIGAFDDALELMCAECDNEELIKAIVGMYEEKLSDECIDYSDDFDEFPQYRISIRWR